jgi:hypothetical protein
MKYTTLILMGLIVFAQADNQCKQCVECKTVCLSNGSDICYDDYEYMRQHGIISANVKIIGHGSCRHDYSSSCICCHDNPISYVCGTDNRTYTNLCELLCVSSKTNYGKLIQLVLLHLGACHE